MIRFLGRKNSDNTEKTDDPDYNAAYKKQFYRTEDGQEVATVAGVIGSGEDDAPCNYPNELVNQGYLRCEVSPSIFAVVIICRRLAIRTF